MPKGGLFYGWWIVIANAAISFYVAGTFSYGSGVFINPIKQELGWSTTEIAFAFSIRSAESGPLSPIVGYFLDRFGPRIVTIFGVVLTGLGFALLSRIRTLPTFYGAFMLLALGTSACMSVTAMTNISNWFVRKRGRALGFYTAGAGLSGLMVPLLAILVDAYGWRTTLLLAGVGLWLVGVPLALVLRHRPERYGLRPDGEEATDVRRASHAVEGCSTKEALTHPSFWLLALALLLSMTSLNAMMIFLVPYLTDPIAEYGLGLTGGIAATAITILTLSSLIGRFGFSSLGDYFEKRYLLTALFLLQACGLLVLALARSTWHLVPFFLLFGPSYGGIIALRSAILADYFGRRCLGTIQGMALGVMTLGGMLAPPLVGGFRDATGGYPWAFVVVAIALFLAVPVLLLARRPVWKGAIPAG